MAESDASRRDFDFARRRAIKRVQDIRAYYMGVAIYAVVMPSLWIINWLTLRPGKEIFWAVWPTFGWGLGLAVWGASLWLAANGGLFGPDWEERKVQEYMARANFKRVSTEKELVQAQLRTLQAQIEPHFLFNTLANVQSLIKREPDTAQRMLDNFIAYLRQSLTASRSADATLGQELDLLRNYLELLKIRMGDRLTYTLDVEPSLREWPMSPMLLQPLVENAVRHGLEPKVEGGHVLVSANQTGAWVNIVVSDNGLGFSNPAEKPAGSGVGLANLRDRLNLLYDGKAKIEVEDLQPGTSVRLSLTAKIS